MMARLIVAAISGALFLLATAAVSLSPQTAMAQTAAAVDEPVSSEKLNRYIEGYNFLNGNFGLPNQARLYAQQQIARKTVSDRIGVAPGEIGLGNDVLKQGKAMPAGGLAEVDEAAGKLIPVLDRLVERLKGLEAYYTTRGQLEDKLARGKREDPLVLNDFKTALAILESMGAALDRATDRRDMATLVALKNAGDLVGFHGGLALQNAKHLIDLFHTPQDVKDKQVLAKADMLADGILQAVTDENKALATASSDMERAMRNESYGSAAKRLQSLVGAYRDLKRSGDPAQHNQMVEEYNAAVQSMNLSD